MPRSLPVPPSSSPHRRLHPHDETNFQNALSFHFIIHFTQRKRQGLNDQGASGRAEASQERKGARLLQSEYVYMDDLPFLTVVEIQALISRTVFFSFYHYFFSACGQWWAVVESSREGQQDTPSMDGCMVTGERDSANQLRTVVIIAGIA